MICIWMCLSYYVEWKILGREILCNGEYFIDSRGLVVYGGMRGRWGILGNLWGYGNGCYFGYVGGFIVVYEF